MVEGAVLLCTELPDPGAQRHRLDMYNLAALTLCCSFLVFEFQLRRQQDNVIPLVHTVRWYMVFAWAYVFSGALSNNLGGCWCPGQVVLAVFQQIFGFAAHYHFLEAARSRVSLLEVAFGNLLMSRGIQMARCALLTIITGHRLWELILGYSICGQGDWPHWICRLCNVLLSVLLAVVALIILRAFALVMHAATYCSTSAGMYVKAEAAWSRTILRKHCVASVFPCLVMSIVYLARGFDLRVGRRQISDASTALLACNMDAICLMILAEIFQQSKPRVAIPKAGLAAPAPMESGASAQGGPRQAKVRELAERSIDILTLLDFFAMLGPGGLVMPRYSAELSTTRDVVREAIIPMSRTNRLVAAYASVVPQGSQSSPPERMVTHAWGNLFVHLVAAVVADALDMKEYSRVALLLTEGRCAELKTQLHSAGVLHLRYWICAFCINQHSNICGGFPPAPPEGTTEYGKWDAARRDTVTGKIYNVCSCTEPKFFNDYPNECELDKFDEMMALLHQEVPHFEHVIAVDRKFELFTRAWCVAELVQGNVAGIPQRVQVLSHEALGIDAGDVSAYVKLVTLTVADCEAFREEDRDAILSKIPDIAEFDAKLQTVIFGEHGLMRQYFTGFEALQAAASIARRIAVVRKTVHGSVGSSSADDSDS